MPNNIVKNIKKKYINNKYIVFLSIVDEIEMLLFYHRAMINIDLLQKTYIPSLTIKSRLSPNLETLDIPGIRKIEENELDSAIFSGSVIIYNYKNKNFYAISMENIPTRQTSDPINDLSISGARDALVESNDKNVALIQKRIKSSELNIEQYKIGDITNTGVVLMYLEKNTNIKIVNNIKEKLNTIKIESLTNIGQLQSFLVNKKALFPLINYSARPDWIAESIIKGRVVILLDGIPLALVAPATFFYFLDYHDSLSENYYVILFDRLLFAIAFFSSVFLAPFMTAVISFYPEFFPLSLLSSTINARKGIASSFISEIILVELLFQTFRIAGSRLAQGMSASLLVIGSLLLGRAVIEAGILSQEALFVGSISVITSYVVSNNSSYNTSINLLRWFLFLFTILFGFIGMSVGFLLIIIYLVSQNTIGTPYMYPLAPFDGNALIKSLIPSNYIEKLKKKMKGKNKQ